MVSILVPRGINHANVIILNVVANDKIKDRLHEDGELSSIG